MTIPWDSPLIADVLRASARWWRRPGITLRQSFRRQTGKYLRGLPTSARRQVDGQVIFLCHATPADLLYEYRPPGSALWDLPEEASAGADVILAGHTHLQFSRAAGHRTIVNPGSLGQSKAGDPRARYAIWENGRIELTAFEYPVERTVEKILAMPLPGEIKRDLIHVLRTGTVP
jgi:diadenosine tetraphosphatase ApaH/serine/threonine PP2A family protein phosphatase